MKKAYQVLAYALAVEVLVQAMAIAYAVAGLGNWVENDGGVLNKKVMDDSSAHFGGASGFAIHGINGEMLIPLITLALLVVAFLSKLPGAVRRAGILVGLVVLQVVLGIASHGLPFAIVLHALNAFGIFVMAAFAGYRAGAPAVETAAHPASVAV